MKTIPMHRVAIVRSFTNFLADAGAPVERGLRRANLPVFALEDVNNFIPSHRFWSFLVDMAFSQDIPELGFHVGQKCGANSVDPHLADLLHRSPTLYQGLLRASALINRTISHCQVDILQPARSQYAYFYHSPSCEARNPAIEQIGWFGLLTLIGMVREFIGPHWLPSEIGVMVDHRPPRFIREQLAGSRIQLAQPYSYIALNKTMLSLPPLDNEAATPGYPTSHYEELSRDFAGSLKQLLHSYVEQRDLNIEVAAGLCDLSKRSLQRKLAAQGTRYSRVLDEARFDVAKQMLQDRDKSVTDTSHLLGYTDPTNFSRAFRRIAGISPQAYRQQISRTADC